MKRILIFLLFLIPSFLNNIAQKQSINAEKIIANTDRDVYIAGENILLNTRIYSEKINLPTPSNVCYVLLRDVKQTYSRIFIRTEADNTGTCSIYIPDTLKTGYYELVAFTNYMRNFGEEHYFRKQIIIVNRFDEWLTALFTQSDTINLQMPEETLFKIKLEKESFKLRERVAIKVVNDSDKNRFINYSFSVRNISPYTKGANLQSQVNSLPPNYPDKILFNAERDGIYLTGRILSSDSLPLSHECLFLSTPDTIVNLQYTYSDIQGNFRFLLNDYYLGKLLVIKPKKNWNGKFSILIDDKYYLKKPFEPVYFGLTPKLRKAIIESRNIVRIQKAYGIVNFNSRQQPLKLKIPYVFQNNSVLVRPADFTELMNFQEISENILPGAKVKNKEGSSFVYLLNRADNYYTFSKPAAIFLDGVYVYDLKVLMNYNSATISKIVYLPALRVIGDLSFSGIVSVSSVNKPKSFDFDAGSCILTMPSFSENVIYKSPNYALRSREDPMPDLRQLLYWNAQQKLPDVEFYTSDISGEFLVEMEALDNDGKIYKAFSTFNVTNK